MNWRTRKPDTVIIEEFGLRRHLEHASRIVPRWWGVLEARPVKSGLRIARRRAGRRNPERSPHALAELLWREEALALLERRGRAQGVRSRPRPSLWRRIGEEFPLVEIAGAVRAAVKARTTR